MKYLFIPFAFIIIISCSKSDPHQKNRNAIDSLTKDKIVKVVGIAKIEPAGGILDLTAGANGIIKKIYVNENDSLHKGNVMVLMDITMDEAQETQANSKVKSQYNEVKSHEASSSGIKIDLDKATHNYALNLKLYDIKAITKETLDDSKFSMEKLKQDYQKSLAEIEQSRSRIKEYEAEAKYYRASMNQKKIIAPSNGTLLSLNIVEGQYVTLGETIGEFAATGPLIAVTEVDEVFADKIKVDLDATIISQSSGEVLGAGKVFFVASYLKKKSIFDDGETQEDRRVREVKIKLNKNCNAIIGSRVDSIIKLQ